MVEPLIAINVQEWIQGKRETKLAWDDEYLDGYHSALKDLERDFGLLTLGDNDEEK